MTARWIGAIWCLVIGGVIVCQLIGQQATNEAGALFNVDSEARPVSIQSDGYAGSQACLECHQREYDTWHASYHRTMTQVPSAETVVGDFDDVQLEIHGRSLRLGRDGENFWVELENQSTDPQQTTTQQIRRNVVLCTGSHRMQIYWLSSGHGRQLASMPFVWLIPEQQWVPRNSVFMLTPIDDVAARQLTDHDLFEFGRWNDSCIFCHTTHGQPQIGDRPHESTKPETTVAEFGISCEACHGPCNSHIQFHRGSDSGKDPVVTPMRLHHHRSSEVCGQCHFVYPKDDTQWPSGSFLTGQVYRPGDNLRELHQVSDGKNPLQFWADGTIRVTGREFNGLLESPCYQRGKMSCFSCHKLHQATDDRRTSRDWADDQLKPRMRTNHACIQCHTEYEAESVLTAHTHHGADSYGSQCQNCHMPNTTYGLLKLTRSHRISSPNTSEMLETGRANACNLCHLDQSLTWTDQHLSMWYGHERKTSSETDDVAVGVSMALTGDPGVRAMAAWHMGWKPAREACGEAWIPPYLTLLMEDDYDAVRKVAYDALRKLPEYDDHDFNYTARPPAATSELKRILSRWQESNATLPSKPLCLISEGARLDEARIQELLSKRQHYDFFYLAE